MKKRKMPKVLTIALIVIGCLVIGMAVFNASLRSMINRAESAYRQIAPVDLSGIADGIYNGRAGEFICSMDLDVTVKDHRIVNIAINRQVNGGGRYQASEMLPRIIKEQSPDVDAVSGATLSSKTVMTAVYRALAGNGR